MHATRIFAALSLVLCSCSSVVIWTANGSHGSDDGSSGESGGMDATSTGDEPSGSSGSMVDAGAETGSTGDESGTAGVDVCVLPQAGFPCVDALNLATSIGCGDDVVCISVAAFVYGLGPQPLVDVATCDPSPAECPAAWSACQMITGNFCLIHTDTTAEECADAFLVNGPADEAVVLATCQAIIDSV